MNWGYLIAAFSSLLAAGFLDNMRGPLFPDILRDLGLSDSAGSWFFSVSAMASIFGSLLAPYFIKRLGPLAGVRLGLALLSTACLCLGAFSDSFMTLLLGGGIMGLSISLLTVSQTLLVQQGSKPQYLRQAISGLHSMYGVASLIAPLVVSFLFMRGFSWRKDFLSLSFIPLIVFLFSLFWKSEPFHQHSQKPIKTKVIFLFQILLGLMVALHLIAELAISSRLVLYLRRELGYSMSSASAWLALFFLLLMIGRILNSLIRDSISHRMILTLSLTLSTVLFVLGLVGHEMFLAFSALTMAPFFPTAMALISESFRGHEDRSISYLMIIVYGMVVFMNWGLGVLSEMYGLKNALLIGPCSLLLSLMMLWGVTEKLRKMRLNGLIPP